MLLPSENTISIIAEMVDEAKLSKPRAQEIADRVARYFVPIVMALTIITFAIWVGVGVAVRKQHGRDAIVQAVTYAIAVLIISCPCAIGLAVPMVTVIAGGVAADYGVVIKDPNTIEIAKRATHVVFDKTGTLTRGQLAVWDEVYPGGSTEETMSVLLGLVSGINHPVSRAVVEHLQSKGVTRLTTAKVACVKTVPGEGVEGTWNGTPVRAGNAAWLKVSQSSHVLPFLSRGSSVFCMAINNELSAVLGLQDEVRPEAFNVVSALTARHIGASIVSGDDAGPVGNVAQQLGIPSTCMRFRCSPIDKQEYIQFIKSSNPKAVILFIGDGTNDALALASADLGIHMNDGTDVARSAAGVVLTRPDLEGVLVLLDISRAAFGCILFNFGWSFVYNLFAILLAAGAFVNARILPAYAGIGEIVSVLPVIAAALLLKWVKFRN
jgi:Cu2+-exporting ATPase